MAKPATSPYKDTVLLPQTSFPMRADLVKNEPARLAHWQQQGLYHQIQDARQGCPTFILHDGPPFANGQVHMGTALNKLLKDLVLKSRAMLGFHCPFIPGWDCHGLPIEFKVVKESKDLAPAEIRRRSEAFARSFVDIQRASFQRLGVFADWDNPYLTLDPAYEADVLRTFADCVEQDLVYRDRRPVQWSYGAQTALAEAEVEYVEKSSTAIFVHFPMAADVPAAAPLASQLAAEGYSLAIWTTTPWTLPANTGIALHPSFSYSAGTFAHQDGRSLKLVIADRLLASFADKTGFALSGQPAHKLAGADLAGARAHHPFLPRLSQVITADFVTDDTGTGAVHIAPGHGADDYVAGRQHGLDLISPVDNLGLYTEECGLPELVGTLVFDANVPIIKLLHASGHLVGKEKYNHQYPHCWRSKTPIIFRAVDQYFIRIDKIRQLALDQAAAVEWLPAWGRARISGTIESRPDWCISRQRTWGVPLPVFYQPDGTPIVDATLARKVADVIEQYGTNLWFEEDDAAWAARLGLPANVSRGRETLDVWIDSGCSHVAVLDRHPLLHAPADLYLEATDQHRGWFQSSLMLSLIARGAAPYRSVLTHGFVVDQDKKRKLSKSEAESAGKPIDAQYFYDKYGADVVRLWVASVDWQNEVPFGEGLFQQTTEVYRRLRNTLRILLANLNDYHASSDGPATPVTLLDSWILERLHETTAICREAYLAFDFRKVFITLNQFVAVDLSAHYIDFTKDRLYCDPPDSPRRRSAQAAMHKVFTDLSRLLAPILAFTADEAWEHAGHDRSIHLELLPSPDPDHAPGPAIAQMARLFQLRELIQQQVEAAIQAKAINKGLEATVTLHGPADDLPLAFLQDTDAATEFFLVSEITHVEAPSLSATVTPTTQPRCERCWRHLPLVSPAADICPRCHSALD